MNKMIIGKEKGYDILTYENALMLYVYGRTSLNSEWFPFLLPNIFYSFHHSLEISIKTILKLKNVSFPTSGQSGHNLSSLLSIAINSGLYSTKVNELVKKEDLIDLLNAMDTSYMDNKYEYPGYDLRGVPVRDLIDEMVFVLFEEINTILATLRHALAVIHVPVGIEESFLHKSKVQFTYTVLSMRKE